MDSLWMNLVNQSKLRLTVDESSKPVQIEVNMENNKN